MMDYPIWQRMAQRSICQCRCKAEAGKTLADYLRPAVPSRPGKVVKRVEFVWQQASGAVQQAQAGGGFDLADAPDRGLAGGCRCCHRRALGGGSGKYQFVVVAAAQHMRQHGCALVRSSELRGKLRGAVVRGQQTEGAGGVDAGTCAGAFQDVAQIAQQAVADVGSSSRNTAQGNAQGQTRRGLFQALAGACQISGRERDAGVLAGVLAGCVCGWRFVDCSLLLHVHQFHVHQLHALAATGPRPDWHHPGCR